MAGIDTLITLRQRELDALRREVSKKEDEKELLLSISAKLHQELMHEREAAGQDVSLLAYMARFEESVRSRQLDIAKAVVVIDAELARLQEQVQEKFGELKKFEIVKENRHKEAKAKADAQEQAAMDEIGIQKFSRKEKDES